MNHFMFHFKPKGAGGAAPLASAPVFVNAGTAYQPGSTTSAVVPLPASRVNGNLLIAYIGLAGSGNFPTPSSGWTLGGTVNGMSMTWAYRFVDGTETACTFTGFTSQTVVGQCIQISGVKAATPIGNTTSASATSTLMSVGGVATIADNSMVLAILFHGGTGIPPTPTNYTSLSSLSNSTMSYRVADETIATAGTTSDGVSVTVSSNVWAIWLLEIRAN